MKTKKRIQPLVMSLARHVQGRLMSASKVLLHYTVDSITMGTQTLSHANLGNAQTNISPAE